jgi:antitoxin (DNA-binding transcriptional repressor) of toxin-antitoxin stability system
VLVRVRAGVEIVIGDEARPVAVFVQLNRTSGCFPSLFVSPKNMLQRLRSTGISAAISKRQSTATVSP